MSTPMTRLFGLFLLAVAFLAPGAANAAACFWVGGTGSINDTTHWASATGGTASTCAAAGGWPNTVSDTATFDASSGGGTITRNVNWTVGTLTMSAFTGTMGNSGDTATVTFNTFNNNGSGTRSLNLGASTWTCGITSCTWNFAGATNQTFAANTSTVVFVGNIGAKTTGLNAYTYNVVTYQTDNATTIGSGNQGSDLNPNGTVTIGTLNLGAGNYINLRGNMNVTTLNYTGGTPSFSAMTVLATNGFGSTIIITLTNAATCDYCAFIGISAATSTITGTNAFRFGSGGTNLSLTAPPPPGGGGGGRIIGG
jgi:hypothetical protein